MKYLKLIVGCILFYCVIYVIAYAAYMEHKPKPEMNSDPIYLGIYGQSNSDGRLDSLKFDAIMWHQGEK